MFSFNKVVKRLSRRKRSINAMLLFNLIINCSISWCTCKRKETPKKTYLVFRRHLHALHLLLVGAAPAPVGEVGDDDEERQKGQGEPGFPGVDLSRSNVLDHQQHPDVGPDGPDAGDDEHPELLDGFDLPRGNAHHADRCDDQKVEGRAADDGERAESVFGFPRVDVAYHFPRGQKDLRGRAAQRHEGEVGHRLVPQQHLPLHLLLPLLVPPHHLALLARDHLDAAHKHIRGDGDANKQVGQGQDVEYASGCLVPQIFCRQQHPGRAGLIVSVGVFHHIPAGIVGPMCDTHFKKKASATPSALYGFFTTVFIPTTKHVHHYVPRQVNIAWVRILITLDRSSDKTIIPKAYVVCNLAFLHLDDEETARTPLLASPVDGTGAVWSPLFPVCCHQSSPHLQRGMKNDLHYLWHQLQVTYFSDGRCIFSS